MKNRYNTLTCLFGHHDYSRKRTVDKYDRFIHLCKICKRSGYWKWDNGDETWYDYDEKGNMIHRKLLGDCEIWYDYDKKGNCIHAKTNDGAEYWYGENGIIDRLKYPDGKCITR